MDYNDYELIYMMNEDEDAFLFLLKKYEPLFKRVSRFYIKNICNKGYDIDDIMQQCRITLYNALERYDSNKDVLFYTYLLVCIKRSIWSMCRTSLKQPDCCYYMEMENYDNISQFVSDVNVSYDYDDYEFENEVINFKNSLTDIESFVFELRYNGFGYKDIACLLDINTKKVDNSLLRIRKKMEKYFLFSKV